MWDMDYAIWFLRLSGLFFMGHGLQKLAGWFGGQGISGTGGWFASLGLNPPRFWAVIAGLAEFLGGAGLLLGFLTPIAAAAVMGVMLMAIIRVHWPRFWITEGGLEYALLNLLVAAFIALTGPGRYSLDTYFNVTYPMPLTFLAALGIAVLGVLFALALARPLPRRQEQQTNPL